MDDTQREMQKKIEQADRERRRVFQLLKGWSNDRFWKWMSWLHSKAYDKAIKHMTEAMECTPGISAAKVQEVLEKTKQIREEWDGLTEIKVEANELIVRDEEGRIKG